MHFSKLRLTGFKSFVDPTELVIAEGLTGVVGPNGCGKSNLLEAMRWVMGENRPSAMRGGGMEDVIFSGAATRPARNFAEVSLTLDNSDRQAPPGFNDHDTLDVVRRITRDAGSAFKTNGKDARARDVQMLFADASTGAHSPSLVRQGQISELINARPKARRRILEEAAGISGLYQRRHEAELKLGSTETNLGRIEDVLDQLEAQLRSLEKQARQAARYREIGEELRRSEGMLLYRRWRESDQQLQVARAALTERTTHAAQATTAASEALRAREDQDQKMPPLREEESVAAAIVHRLKVEKDTLVDQETRARQEIETLTGRIAQLKLDIEREAGLNRDAGESIERLEWEQDALSKASEGSDEAVLRAEEQAREASAALQEKEETLSQLTEDVARLAARHQSAHRLVQDATSTLDRNSAEADKAEDAVRTASEKLAAAEALAQTAQSELERSTAAAQSAEDRLLQAEQARTSAQEQEADARADRSGAEGEAKALLAEVNALTRLVDRDQDAETVLLDRVEVDPGFEAALGAALADDLRAPEINTDGSSGWASLPNYSTAAELPVGCSPLGDHVAVPGVLARRMSQVGLVDRIDGNRLQSDLKPGQRLVSCGGDLWRWDGFRVGADDAPSASALQLQQRNRLRELQSALETASAQSGTAVAAHDQACSRLQDLTAEDHAARASRREADQALTDANRNSAKAEADRSISGGNLEALRMAVIRYQEAAVGADLAVREAQSAVEDLADLDMARADVERAKVEVETARGGMLSRRSAFDEIRRETEARIKRVQEVRQELSGWRLRMETASKRENDLSDRQSTSESELELAQAAPAEIVEKQNRLDESVQGAESRRREASDALALGETSLRSADTHARDAEKQASEAREDRARAEAMCEATAMQTEAAVTRIREDLDASPQDLLEQLDADPEKMPSAEAMDQTISRLRRQRDALGAVNLRAEEDAGEVQSEFEALRQEKNDLEQAVAKLRSGIASLNREGRERLLKAFDDVNTNFEVLFRHLFGGGDAKLVLVESADPLEAGLEIMCQPPGKKLSTLSLLSGGEQTLTALSLIFAVFLANPSPICVLDEVDAPLDDANVTRFCDLLDEMIRQTQTRFLIITHHAITMARVDRLFGVTMAEQGVSQLVSVDLTGAEKLVA